MEFLFSDGLNGIQFINGWWLSGVWSKGNEELLFKLYKISKF